MHHFAALLGYGARAVNPYLAQETIGRLIDEGMLDKDFGAAVDDYNKAILRGIVKIASKMGVSTLQSYQSAQLFEAVGIAKDVVDEYFTNTVSRIGGIGLKEIEAMVDRNHSRAFDPLGLEVDLTLDSAGTHKARSGQEDHMYSPQAIHLLQQAARTGDYGLFKQYSALVDDENSPHTLRGLMEMKYADTPIPLDEGESVELRLHLPGGPRVSGPGHEPVGGQVQLRRGGRAARAATKQSPLLRHQAGGVGPVRGHQRVPGECPGAPDQNGPGGQARRGRPPAWKEGVPLDRQDPLLHPRRAADLPAAPP